MAEATIIQEKIQCLFHKENCLSLYCCDCSDVICVQCLLDRHQKHELKSLQMAKSNILDLVRQKITAEKKHPRTEIEEQLSKEISSVESDEKRIKVEIEQLVEKRKNEIDKSGNDLIFSFQRKYEDYKQFLKNINEKISASKPQMADVIDKGLENVDVNKQITLYLNMKQRDMALKEFQTNQAVLKPKFDTCMIGLGLIQSDNYAEIKADKIQHSIETLAAECNIKFPVKIEQQSLQNQPISKILPLDDENAFILGHRNIYKIERSMVYGYEEDLTYLTDDFAVLKDGSILLLKKEKGFIKRLYKKRILNFVDSGKLIPQCICVSSDNHVFLCLIESREDGQPFLTVVVKFDSNGILLKRFEFNNGDLNYPLSMTTSSNNSDIYITYKSGDSAPPLTHVLKVVQMKKTLTNKFCGVIGIQPSECFKCLGLCNAGNDKLLVSDWNHHTVLLVNESLEFVKFVLSADDGLATPGPIALLNNIMWIADKDSVWKFKYDES